MQTDKLVTWAAVAVCMLCSNGSAQDTHAGQAVKNGVAASGNASASAAHSVAASGQVTSAMSAVPLLLGGAVIGSAGVVSAAAGHDSMKAAMAPIGTPLQISDEAITVIPPNQALQSKTKESKP